MTMKLTMRPRRKWTEADFAKMVALLKDGVPVVKVAKQLQRSEAAIRVQATKVRVSASGNLAQRAKRNQEFVRNASARSTN
ncbi:hypothetical protein [Tardiphaga sp.]|jgi:hypothetical protein|uniref:hypothetical protein n=1 Tax=Tardiphaga sp. TaxID=1926292 RepID=UPI0037DA6FDC